MHWQFIYCMRLWRTLFRVLSMFRPETKINVDKRVNESTIVKSKVKGSHYVHTRNKRKYLL